MLTEAMAMAGLERGFTGLHYRMAYGGRDVPNSEKERLAAEVEDWWVDFRDALSNKRRYPVEQFRAFWIEGTVVLDAVVGIVKELSVRTGHPLLAESAAETVRQWRYRPTTVNGRPVEVQTDIEVKFTLPDSVVSS
jgi:outer membrane biosynthesis protein TonB